MILSGRERRRWESSASLHATTSQTVGPFFALGLEWLNSDELAAAGVSGERVTIEGRVLDGDGAPVPDALLEVWQANAHGKYAHPEDVQDKPLEPGFSGYGRIPTDAEGRFRFTSVKPGPVPGPGGGPRLRTSWSRCSRAACWCGSSPGSTSRTSPRTPTTSP